MSGDSPIMSQASDFFDFQDGASSTPSTSKDSGYHPLPSDIGVSSSTIEPSKAKDKDDEPEIDFNSPIANNDYEDTHHNSYQNEETKNLEDSGHKNAGAAVLLAATSGPKKINGESDKLDGVWIPKEDKAEEEEGFCFKCLYFSMQCCECSIM